MLGKIKKVLISLSLAASLALAPMNVYGAGDDNNTQSGSAINSNNNLCASDENTDSIETPINVTIEDSYSWTVFVPEKFSLDSSNSYADSGSIELDDSSVIDSKILNVTPHLNYADVTYESCSLNMTIASGSGGKPAIVEDSTASFTKDDTGNDNAASLTIKIEECLVDTWKASKPDGLNDEKVAGIKYEIALTDQPASP